jgi:archaetidylinositol phosphate synthase
MAETRSHTRVNDILLGPLERPALRWLAAHMPAWVTPDVLTVIGLGGSLLT